MALLKDEWLGIVSIPKTYSHRDGLGSNGASQSVIPGLVEVTWNNRTIKRNNKHRNVIKFLLYRNVPGFVIQQSVAHIFWKIVNPGVLHEAFYRWMVGVVSIPKRYSHRDGLSSNDASHSVIPGLVDVWWNNWTIKR